MDNIYFKKEALAFMIAKLFPKERDFFPFFDQISNYVSRANSELLEAVNSPGRLENAARENKKIESEVLGVTRQAIESLHETFVTPFDRGHIFKLLIQLCEIVTLTQLVTEKLSAYKIEKLPIDSTRMIVKCGEACYGLRNMVYTTSQY